MAIIRNLTQISLEKDTQHSEVEGTFSIVDFGGEKYLQIDTYGSNNRQLKGKKSQSIRFPKEVIIQLKEIINAEF
jgi:hypothetical protein